ncbi:MAG: hypothetical protein U5N58_15220 [Actinomycetota bacterium]|nr:hypothetical protein [Actinomycetota bacterium]
MSSLETVGLIALIFIGGIVISAIILAIPLVSLIKKYKGLSRKLDEQVLPLAEQLKDSSLKLNQEMESVQAIKNDLENQFAEINIILNEIKGIRNNPLKQFVGSSFEIISMFSKGRQDE